MQQDDWSSLNGESCSEKRQSPMCFSKALHLLQMSNSLIKSSNSLTEAKHGGVAFGGYALFFSFCPSCRFHHSLGALSLLMILFLQFFLLPNSANNGCTDTVVGKITALHFSTPSLFPPLFFSMTGGRDDAFSLKKGESTGEWSV